MAQPLPYERDYDFQNFQSGHPSTPLPGDKVNAELDQVAATLDEVLARIALLQDDDTALKRGSVGRDQLAANVDLGFDPPTTWATATAYIANNTVFSGTEFYQCLVSHTSGTFSTDLAAGKWELIADFTPATADAEAAQAAAEAAQALAEAARDSATASASSASSNAASASASANSASADAEQTAADRIATAADRVATAADRVQTGLDVVSSAASAAAAAASAASIVIGPGGVQEYSENLAGVAAISPTDGNFIVGNGTTLVAESGATARVSLGFGDGTVGTAGLDVLSKSTTEDILTYLDVENSAAIQARVDAAEAFADMAETAKTATEAARDVALAALGAAGNYYTDTTHAGAQAAAEAALSIGDFYAATGDDVDYVGIYKVVTGPDSLEYWRQYKTSAIDAAPGVLTLTSVAGTSSAYTATSARTLASGQWILFTPHVTNSVADPTLSINGGTAYNIGGRTGSSAAGALVSGIPLLLRFTGTVFRIHEPLSAPVARVTSVAGTGTAYTGTLGSVPIVSNELLIEFTPHVTNTGSCTLALNGGSAVYFLTENGSEIPAGKLLKNSRYLCWWLSAGIFVIGLSAEVPADERVIDGNERLRRTSASEFALAIGGEENSPIYALSSATDLWIATAGDQHRLIYVAGAVTVDLQLMPVRGGVPTMIYVAAGGGNEAKLYQGPGLKTLTAAAGSLVQVFRPADDVFVVTAMSGSVTEESDVNDPAPARDMTIITGGQSLARGWLIGAGLHGLQLGFADVGWWPTVWPVQGATGGSGITAASNATNYWWDTVGSLPGPSALAWKAALDAIPAEQPAPAAIYWCFGETDANVIGTAFTIDQYADYLRDLFAWMRSEVGDANLPIIISPLGSQEAPVPTDAQFAAIRWVQISLAAEDANIHLGPSLYDLPRRHYDAHPNHQGQKLQGYRLAKTLNNLFNGGTDNLGPYVSNLEELDSGGRYRLTVEVSSTNVPFSKFTENNGFAVIPAGTTPLSGTPVKIGSQYWGLSGGKWQLNLVLASPSVGATVVFPWGGMDEVNTGRFIRDITYWKVAGNGAQNHQPLREFIGSAGEPPVAPVIP